MPTISPTSDPGLQTEPGELVRFYDWLETLDFDLLQALLCDAFRKEQLQPTELYRRFRFHTARPTVRPRRPTFTLKDSHD